MGYHTYYELHCLNEPIPDEAYDLADKQFSAGHAGALYTEQAITWYSSHEDMLEFSKKFPDSVFCLHGVGDEDDDRWNAYYKNGKSQMCPVRFEYDEYDEEKLK